MTLDEGGRFTGEAEKKLEEVIHISLEIMICHWYCSFLGQPGNAKAGAPRRFSYLHPLVDSSAKELKAVLFRKRQKTLRPQQR